MKRLFLLLLLASNFSAFAVEDYWIEHAKNVIENDSTYGGDVTVLKKKNLFKYGRNTDVDANELTTVMELQGTETEETEVTTNVIDQLVSDNNSNTMSMYVEGHTCSGSGESLTYTFVTQTKTLTGQTGVSLDTPLCNITRLRNNSGTELQANSKVFGFQSTSAVSAGTPTDNTKIHIVLSEALGDNSSNKAATAFSNVDYGILTQVKVGILKKTSATCDFKIQSRAPGKVYVTIYPPITVSSSAATIPIPLVGPYPIVFKNHRVRVMAECDTANTDVSADLTFALLTVK